MKPFTAIQSLVTLSALGALALTGCRTPAGYREQADSVATAIVDRARRDVTGKAESFHIERPAVTLRRRLMAMQDLPAHSAATLSAHELVHPSHWPGSAYPLPPESTNAVPVRWTRDGSIEISLLDALQIAARNSHDYQGAKEDVFQAALDLDLQQNAFRATFAGTLDSEVSSDRSGDDTVEGVDNGLVASVNKTFKTGAAITGRLAVDLVKLLTGDRESAWGLSADATISIPLLRGAGRHITREPLTQAERNVVYAIYRLEEFKRGLAITVAESFLGVMQAGDRAYNAQRNYDTLADSAERARSVAEAGRLPEIQVDQAHQDQLRAYDRLVSARQEAEQTLDRFKVVLGLPPDAEITLNRDAFTELVRDAEARSTDAVPIPDSHAVIAAALENRFDLLSAVGSVHDAQRAVVIAADALRAEISLLGSAAAGSSRSLGSAGQGDADLEISKGILSGLLTIDLPIERTAERNAFRSSIIDLERAVRNAQAKEDAVKLQVRSGLRELAASRESTATQLKAARLAERRQHSTDLFLKAGRAQMRDLLEAEESLLSARNALTSAIINYRLAELRLQRDVGVLQVTDAGLLKESPLIATESRTRKLGADSHE